MKKNHFSVFEKQELWWCTFKRIWPLGFRPLLKFYKLIYGMRCAIWYHLYNLKNMKNTRGRVLLLLPCNLTKSNTPLWVGFTFFKLYKWYRIVQNIKVWKVEMFYNYSTDRLSATSESILEGVNALFS